MVRRVGVVMAPTMKAMQSSMALNGTAYKTLAAQYMDGGHSKSATIVSMISAYDLIRVLQ